MNDDRASASAPESDTRVLDIDPEETAEWLESLDAVVGSVVVRALQLLAARGEVDAAAPAQAAERCRLLDVNAGTSGNAGGDA